MSELNVLRWLLAVLAVAATSNYELSTDLFLEAGAGPHLRHFFEVSSTTSLYFNLDERPELSKVCCASFRYVCAYLWLQADSSH